MFDCVVAADLDWGIGNANALPWPKLAGDMAHFKRITSEAGDGKRNAVIQGRRTWESAEVKARPLPRRLNIVISRSAPSLPAGVAGARSLEEALAVATQPDIETAFVIGGAQIFREAFAHPALRSIYLTRVLGRFDCDVVLQNLDELGFVPREWSGAFEGEDNGVRYRVERLARSEP